MQQNQENRLQCATRAGPARSAALVAPASARGSCCRSCSSGVRQLGELVLRIALRDRLPAAVRPASDSLSCPCVYMVLERMMNAAASLSASRASLRDEPCVTMPSAGRLATQTPFAFLLLRGERCSFNGPVLLLRRRFLDCAERGNRTGVLCPNAVAEYQQEDTYEHCNSDFPRRLRPLVKPGQIRSHVRHRIDLRMKALLLCLDTAERLHDREQRSEHISPASHAERRRRVYRLGYRLLKVAVRSISCSTLTSHHCQTDALARP